MWKCSACQNENKDEYRYCLNCGNPRPAPAAPAGRSAPAAKKDGKKSASLWTLLLLILALLLVVAIIAVILLFSRTRERDVVRRPETQATESPETGGTSSFVFGSEGSAPAETPIPIPKATPVPSAAPESTPAPTAAPTAGDYLIPGSDSRYLTEDDLKNLTWEQCTLARNEIFARHGRIFVSPQIARYFEGKDWYTGTISAANFSENVLNEFERANVSFISQYESDHWGGSYY